MRRCRSSRGSAFAWRAGSLIAGGRRAGRSAAGVSAPADRLTLRAIAVADGARLGAGRAVLRWGWSGWSAFATCTAAGVRAGRRSGWWPAWRWWRSASWCSRSRTRSTGTAPSRRRASSASWPAGWWPWCRSCCACSRCSRRCRRWASCWASRRWSSCSAVTSGFEREFQDKVLALNAHLIVQAYGDADFARRWTTSSAGSRACPASCAWRRSCSRRAR